jgi:hypothetical protein
MFIVFFIKSSAYISPNPVLSFSCDNSISFVRFFTTVGLYNDDNELLMVAKLGKPIMLSPDTDTTFIVKYDT